MQRSTVRDPPRMFPLFPRWLYEGAVESFLNPKLTNRLNSENTSLRSPPPRSAVAIEPVGGPFGGGDVIAAKMLSPLLPPLIARGNETRLPPGLTRLPPSCPGPGGSMSKEDKKDVLSSSGLVLVIVRKESSRALCWAFGAPLRSKIYNVKFPMRGVS